MHWKCRLFSQHFIYVLLIFIHHLTNFILSRPLLDKWQCPEWIITRALLDIFICLWWTKCQKQILILGVPYGLRVYFWKNLTYFVLKCTDLSRECWRDISPEKNIVPKVLSVLLTLSDNIRKGYPEHTVLVWFPKPYYVVWREGYGVGKCKLHVTLYMKLPSSYDAICTLCTPLNIQKQVVSVPYAFNMLHVIIVMRKCILYDKFFMRFPMKIHRFSHENLISLFLLCYFVLRKISSAIRNAHEKSIFLCESHEKSIGIFTAVLTNILQKAPFASKYWRC